MDSHDLLAGLARAPDCGGASGGYGQWRSRHIDAVDGRGSGPGLPFRFGYKGSAGTSGQRKGQGNRQQNAHVILGQFKGWKLIGITAADDYSCVMITKL
ncbi:hypothetical protein ACHMW6_12355 [Pseudoduganella sp. UC29_106]|uniref:hypothetical protein n=1 Tax=Pseudoduganella sp. UC29_106 TaxID=3374553 RepID=UPI0037576224